MPNQISESQARLELGRIVRRVGESSVLLKRLKKRLGRAGFPKKLEISVTLVTDAKMKALNTRYRGKTKTTDILSFPAPIPLQKLGHLGELVISKGALKRQAAEWGHPLKSELRVLLVHGVIHLLGFDHEESSREYREQLKAERILFKLLGWKLSGLMKRASDR